MSNISKLEFVTLDISGNNYLTWTLDAKIHLTAKNLAETINDGNETSLQEKAKAMIFLSHHLYEDLKMECLTVEYPLELWKTYRNVLTTRSWSYSQKLATSGYISGYKTIKLLANTTLISFASPLTEIMLRKITDEDMLEKTFSTFHASCDDHNCTLIALLFLFLGPEEPS